MITEQELYEIDGQPKTQAELLIEWYKVDEELAKAKAREAKLRPLVVKAYIGDVKEGTQKAELNEGWILNVQGKVNRTVLPDMIAPVTLAMAEAHPTVSVDELIKYKPELVLSAYRQLTEEERIFFDQMLEIKDGTPQVEIKLPKRPARPK